jgi:hypothetical protein
VLKIPSTPLEDARTLCAEDKGTRKDKGRPEKTIQKKKTFSFLISHLAFFTRRPAEKKTDAHP